MTTTMMTMTTMVLTNYALQLQENVKQRSTPSGKFLGHETMMREGPLLLNC
jgi:hypothetical protein